MVADPLRFITPEEYLRREKEAETKSEFLNGEIIAMAGASPTHVRITATLMRVLGIQLLGKTCEPFSQDLRVGIAGLSALLPSDFTYPDVVVACDAQFDDDYNLLNPVVIIEVLSPSTELKDRTLKLDAYRHIATLRDYVLIAQNQRRVEHYRRLDAGEWRWRIFEAPGEEIVLDSIGCTLKLSEIYERVPLPDVRAVSQK